MIRPTILHGDCREAVATLADESVDSVVTDPPYALVSIGKRFGADNAAPAKGGVYGRASAGFMGQKWDVGDTAHDPAFWVEVMRVLKPGGHVLAFAGTRTYHRLACAIEDGGFEIRDQIAWLYGSGFPKSHDVSKGIDKALGANRRVVSEGAPVKRMIPGADQHKGGWEKNSGRDFVPTVTAAGSPGAAKWEGWGTALKPALEPICVARKPLIGTVAANVLAHGTGALNIDACRVEGFVPSTVQGQSANAGSIYGADQRDQRAFAPNDAGRWPANVVHDGSDEVLAAFPETQSGAFQRSETAQAMVGANGIYGHFQGAPDGRDFGPANSGSAARFFYTAKADAEDRLGSKHPTVKPLDLMAWLIKLVTPPGGLVLDPFAGTGSTGVAAMINGFASVLIEREAQYVSDIERRIAWASGDGRLTAQETARSTGLEDPLPLFEERR